MTQWEGKEGRDVFCLEHTFSFSLEKVEHEQLAVFARRIGMTIDAVWDMLGM